MNIPDSMPRYTVAAEENPRGMAPGLYYFVRRSDGVRVSLYTRHVNIAYLDRLDMEAEAAAGVKGLGK